MRFDWDNATPEERLNYLRREIGSIALALESETLDRVALQRRFNDLERQIKGNK